MTTSSTSAIHLLCAKWRVICFLAVSILAFSGCTSVQVKLGWKVYLAKTPVVSMDAKLAKGPAIAPGQKAPLIVTLTEPNGRTLTTEGAGQGKVMWKELQLTSSIVTVNKKGLVSLAKDPRISDGKVGHVTITAPSHPDLHAYLDIPFRYDIKYVANFSGASGSNGMDGTDGLNGVSGSAGSIDPNNPSPGGDGSNGGNGSDGGNGNPGGDAPPVMVSVALQPGTHPLLQVSVSAHGIQRLYLVDPNGGSLTVTADGGEGGAAGKGGRAGRGGTGGIGSPNGSDGHDGLPGQDGLPGSRGNGGLITVTYDPQVAPFLSSIHLSSANGPRPVFKEESVVALW